MERSMWHLHRQNGRILPETAAKIGVIPGDLLLPNCGISGPNRCAALQILWPHMVYWESDVTRGLVKTPEVRDA